MSPFRARHGESEIKTSQEKVIESLEKSGLSKRDTLLIGGGALALAGIRPASDVDVFVPGNVFRDLAQSKRTPSGLYLQDKRGTFRPFLETVPGRLPSDILGFDIGHP